MKSICLLWPLMLFSIVGHAYNIDEFVKERTTRQLSILLKYIDLPTWNLNEYADPIDNYILDSKEESKVIDKPISIKDFFTK